MTKSVISQLQSLGFRPCSYSGCLRWVGPVEGSTHLDQAQMVFDDDVMQCQSVVVAGTTVASGDAWCCMEHLLPADFRHVEMQRPERNRRKRDRKRCRR